MDRVAEGNWGPLGSERSWVFLPELGRYGEHMGALRGSTAAESASPVVGHWHKSPRPLVLKLQKEHWQQKLFTDATPRLMLMFSRGQVWEQPIFWV